MRASRHRTPGQPGSRPQAGSLARAQDAADHPVISSLLPGNYQLADELEARLLALLDGTRDPAVLAAELHTPEPAVRAAVSRLTAEGLLVSDCSDQQTVATSG